MSKKSMQSMRSMPKSVLKSAHRLYRKKKFAAVIRLLEGQIFRFRENLEFFSLLGNACLYSSDLGGAFSYLKRAEQLDPQHVPSLLGLAAIAARRRETETAVRIWLRVLELDPRQRKARRGLDLMRRVAAVQSGDLRLDARDLKHLYPSTGVRLGFILIPAVAVLIIALTGFLLQLLPGMSLPLLHRQAGRAGQQRPGIAEITFSAQHPTLVTEREDALFSLSEDEIAEVFELAKSYLLKYRDNLAIREVNKIILSNASAYAREKASLLKTFAEIPDFVTLKDNFSWQEVKELPPLYEDCFVIWSGKLANLAVGDDFIAFDLLVGYEHERELLGIVPVRLDFGVDLENGIAVEVLGKVRLTEEEFMLEGVSIHRLLERES
jgi:tetratricopeptide (TPR) repeat protein